MVAVQISEILRGFVWEKGCWIARLTIHQLFPIQILLPFPIFLYCCQILYSNSTDLKLGSFYLFLPALFISGIHKVPGLSLRVGRSRDQVLQRAHCKSENAQELFKMFKFSNFFHNFFIILSGKFNRLLHETSPTFPSGV